LKPWHITDEAAHQIGAAFPFHLGPLREPRLSTGLMKGDIAGFFVTFRDWRNIHIIKRIGETVMAVLNLELTIAAGIKG
jgi:hypothetical protein